MSVTKSDYELLKVIADMDEIPGLGAYNIRKDGEAAARHSSEKISIEPKSGKPGIVIRVRPDTVGETVHIPVILTKTGLTDLVYNDFYIGENADVTIIAGCGIHNNGCETSRHDGIHRFFIGKNARVKYVEKHYGEGEGSGKRILNPVTELHLEENAGCEMDTVQIRGVSSTNRKTEAFLEAGAKIKIFERLMTHEDQTARSEMTIQLNGEGASAQIISRSVARDQSVQRFYPMAIGNAPCHAHIRCDSIIMDHAKIASIPAIEANHPSAEVIHEAAIGRINNDQLLKLMTFGLDEQEAENVILKGFLK